MRPQMRQDLANLARKPLQALRSGRFWLSPVVARLSPRAGTMMSAVRLEEEGRYEEAYTVWKSLNGAGQPSFRFTMRRARLALRAGAWKDALDDYEILARRSPGDARVKRGIESAALRGARAAQIKGQWLEACRLWASYGRTRADFEKCVKNLGDCARYVAQSADSTEKMAGALEAWSLLKEIDPDSREAQQGMEWCRLSLARAAERASDYAAARQHWNALLALAPGDQRAVDGIRRLDAAAA
jgi:tetratricopeptide (TPR) repeat protein